MSSSTIVDKNIILRSRKFKYEYEGKSKNAKSISCRHSCYTDVKHGRIGRAKEEN